MQSTKASWMLILTLMSPVVVPGVAMADGSNHSAFASALIVLIPVSIVVGASEKVSGSVESAFRALSKAVGGEARWTVKDLKPDGDKTQITLYSSEKDTTLVLAVPAKQATAMQVRAGDTVVSRPEGRHSFSFRSNNQTLGVVVDESAMSHSKKLN